VDAPSAQDVTALIQTVDQLKLGAMLFLGFLVLVAVGVYAMWLRARAHDRKAETQAAAAAQEAENARSARLTDALDKLASAMSDHEKWEVQQFANLKSAMESDIHEVIQDSRDQIDRVVRAQATIAEVQRTQTDRIVKQQEKASSALADGIASLRDIMQRMLDRQNGLMTADDSRRVIKNAFDSMLLPEFSRICEASIRNNDFERRAAFIKEKVCGAMNKTVNNVLTYLNEYKMTIDYRKYFSILTDDGIRFPGDPGALNGKFCLTLECWNIVERIHLAKFGEGKTGDLLAEAKAAAVEQCKTQLDEVIRISFLSGDSKALDIYSENTTRVLQRHTSEEVPRKGAR
jgi:hypothetical protein